MDVDVETKTKRRLGASMMPRQSGKFFRVFTGGDRLLDRLDHEGFVVGIGHAKP
jgi:hypothetical protein